MKYRTKHLLVIPFLLHLVFILVVGGTALYTYLFLNETTWLFFANASNPSENLGLFFLPTLLCSALAIPALIDAWNDDL